MTKGSGGTTAFRTRKRATRAERYAPRQRDNFTPVFFATLATVFFVALVHVLLHTDSDMHLFNYIMFGLFTFAVVGVAADANVNG